MECYSEDEFPFADESVGIVEEVVFNYQDDEPNAAIFVRLYGGSLAAIFRVHRDALDDSSPALAAALAEGPFAELQALCRADVKAMHAGLAFLHSNKLPLVDSSLNSVIFRLGLLWQADSLCSELRHEEMACDSSLDAFLLYDLLEKTEKKHTYPEVAQRLLKLVAEDPMAVFRSDAWKVSHVQSVEAVLSVDTFPAGMSELDVLQAVMSWGWHVYGASGGQIPAAAFFHRLLKKVRFVSIEVDQLFAAETILKDLVTKQHLQRIIETVVACCPCRLPLSYSRKHR
ncbi:Hypothetical predicted protein [Cloeon dipterum]|uniref:Uncharacterized protein n=1 Tax=Cloeon dipterum TaxID=197152 RepID=A0A8S1CYU7_9INSE|nr:Hypothetical predicted protein [Cloeon dipterum]